MDLDKFWQLTTDSYELDCMEKFWRYFQVKQSLHRHTTGRLFENHRNMQELVITALLTIFLTGCNPATNKPNTMGGKTTK